MVSFIFTIPFKKNYNVSKNLKEFRVPYDLIDVELLLFMLTAFYELTQIIINNSDIILVKHYFNNEQVFVCVASINRPSGLFCCLMFVMLLFPK
jgi:hypothetical protein